MVSSETWAAWPAREGYRQIASLPVQRAAHQGLRLRSRRPDAAGEDQVINNFGALVIKMLVNHMNECLLLTGNAAPISCVDDAVTQSSPATSLR
jgi:hypothetical protein